MAVYKIFPTKDATIYSLYPQRNSGLDEILELSLQNNDLISTGNNEVVRPEASRILIQFDPTTVQSLLSSGWKAYLKLYLANASNIPKDFTIYAYPVSESWDMGTGRYHNSPQTTDGVSWYYRTETELWQTGSFSSGVTASFSSSEGGGGNWYTASVASQSFSFYDEKDVEMDVTEIVHQWLSSSIDNNGFLVKQGTEFVTQSIFDLKYFSRDTHTIYPPCLEFRWDNSQFITGSGTVVSNEKIVITLNQNQAKFYEDAVQKFRLNVRDRYPARAFQTSSVYLNNKFLPSQSYWAIKDLHTDEFVVNFDTGSTKISCDGTSSYFDVYMNGLEPERNYKFLIKTVIGSQTIILDDNYYFKVIK